MVLVRMKYVKFEHGYAYYRRGVFRKRLNGEPRTPQFITSYNEAHAAYEYGPTDGIETITRPGSFKAMAQAYLKSPEFAGIKDSTKRGYRHYTDMAVRQLGRFNANQIEMKHVVGLRDKLTDTPAKANDLMKMIRVIYGWGMPRGMVRHNPADFRGTSVKALKIGSYKPWPEPLIERFVAEPRPEVSWVALTCLYTGQRIGDILKMNLSDVRDDKVTVIQEKTAKPLKIPLHPDFRQLLSVIPRRSVKILSSYTGKVWTYTRWSTCFAEERERLGADGYVIHGLRKNVVHRLLYAGCTTKQVGSITGQSDAIVEYYAKEIEQQRLAVVAMEKYAEWTKQDQKW